MTVKASATITLFDVSDGEDGTSVTVKSIAYATSTTNTKPSTISGSFPSTLTKGTYLWTRVTYSDGSKADTVSYLGTDGDITEAISQAKAAAQVVVDDLEIGGRNLLGGTEGLYFSKAYSSYIDSETYNDFTVLTCDNTSKTSGYTDFAYAYNSSYNYLGNVEADGVYTLSFWCKGTVNDSAGHSTGFYSYMYKGTNTSGKNECAEVITSQGLDWTSSNDIDDGRASIAVSDEWQKVWITRKFNSTASTPKEIIFLRCYWGTSISICGLKLEKGNKATDWTPAPEDVDDDISDAVNASEAAMLDAYKDYLKTTLGIEEGFTMDLNSVDKFLKAGIIDKDGASLMTQTEDGWVFSISDLQKDIASAASAASSAAATANTATGNLSNLNKNLSDNGVWDLTSQIKIVKSSDGKSAQITIGGSNEFTLELTNNQIAFKQASETVAYIKSNKEYISRAQLTDELQFGGEDEDPNYVFKTHNNGNNLGIIWKGDD